MERCCGRERGRALLQGALGASALSPRGAQKRGGQREAQGSSTSGALVPRATSYSHQPEATCPHCLPNLLVRHLLWPSTPPVPITTWPSPSFAASSPHTLDGASSSHGQGLSPVLQPWLPATTSAWWRNGWSPESRFIASPAPWAPFQLHRIGEVTRINVFGSGLRH